MIPVLWNAYYELPMIKILSLYYKNYNYGGQLQAWALSYVLKRQNKDCVHISFQSKAKFKSSVWARLSSITVEKILNKLNQFFNLKFKKKLVNRRTKFIEFEREIPHTKVYCEKTINECVEANDIFVVGSDQVWNPDWTSSTYFLDFVPTSNLKISYAASLGKNRISNKFLGNVSRYLDDFDYISVREKEAKEILENYLDKRISLVLDPTLLMDEKEWGSLAVPPVKDRSYLFVYLLGNNKNHKKKIKEYAKRRNLEIVYIPHVHFYYQIADNSFADKELYDIGPKEFLGLIQNATEVITDSFHGCVFSIIFKKQFCALKRHQDNLAANMNSRLYTLFDSLELRSRLFEDYFSSEDMLKIMSSPIDYENTEKILVELRKQSLDYLMNAVSDNKQ